MIFKIYYMNHDLIEKRKSRANKTIAFVVTLAFHGAILAWAGMGQLTKTSPAATTGISTTGNSTSAKKVDIAKKPAAAQTAKKKTSRLKA